MRQRIAELQEGPLGRAIASRVDVIFVPYGNEGSFHQGAALYTVITSYSIHYTKLYEAT